MCSSDLLATQLLTTSVIRVSMLPTRKGNNPMDTSVEGDWATNVAPKTRVASLRSNPIMAQEYMPHWGTGDSLLPAGG